MNVPLSLSSVRVACAALLACAVGSGSARPEDITAGELALAPPFCQDVQSINGWTKDHPTRSPRADEWIGIMGETFWAMHHFCYGLIQRQRSRAAGLTPQAKDFLLRETIREHQYVVRNSRPDYIMLPEIFYRIGEAHAALDEHQLAIEAFQKARDAKADYWPAYLGWATTLVRTNRRQDAINLITEGLKQVPDNPQLLRQLQELKGEAPRSAASVRR